MHEAVAIEEMERLEARLRQNLCEGPFRKNVPWISRGISPSMRVTS
jgi:hypothetical protein